MVIHFSYCGAMASFLTIQAYTYALRVYEQSVFQHLAFSHFTWFIGFYISNWGQGTSSKRGRQRERERARMEVSLFSALFTISHCLQPALLKDTHRRPLVCVYVRVIARARAR